MTYWGTRIQFSVLLILLVSPFAHSELNITLLSGANWASYEKKQYLYGATYQYQRKAGYQISLMKEFPLTLHYSARFKIEYLQRRICKKTNIVVPGFPTSTKVLSIEYINLTFSNKLIPIATLSSIYFLLEPKMSYIAQSDIGSLKDIIWGVNAGLGCEIFHFGNYKLLVETLYQIDFSSSSIWGNQPIEGNSIEISFGLKI